MENHRVVGLDPNDPIQVNYQKQVGNDPTGKEHPELLKMQSSPGQGHNNTIVNGIGRIGYMTGGTKARWVDEEVSTTFLSVAQQFIEDNKTQPFFLFFALTEPHVPRMPATFFKGKSDLGYRGDAILQLDWTVGKIMDQLELLGIADKSIIIFFLVIMGRLLMTVTKMRPSPAAKDIVQQAPFEVGNIVYSKAAHASLLLSADLVLTGIMYRTP